MFKLSHAHSVLTSKTLKIETLGTQHPKTQKKQKKNPTIKIPFHIEEEQEEIGLTHILHIFTLLNIDSNGHKILKDKLVTI